MHGRTNDRDLLKQLVKTRFKLRYNNSVLGFIWVLMKPFFEFLILFLVFSAVRGRSATLTTNILIGTMTYGFFRELIKFGMNSLLDFQNIILKMNMPRHLAVRSSVIMSLINFVINMLMVGVIIVVLAFTPDPIGIVYYLFMAMIMAFFVYGLSFFMSVFVIRFRDLSDIVDLGLQLFFWASGIFYTLDEAEGSPLWIFMRINPVALVIDGGRRALFEGEIRYFPEMILFLLVSFVIYKLGISYFRKAVPKVAEYF